MKNNLLLIITDLGSFNNFLKEVSLEIIKNNSYELSVICSKNKVIDVNKEVKFLDKKIKFYYVDIPRSLNFVSQLRASFEINKLIKLINPKIIHIHFTTAIFTTLLTYTTNKKRYVIGTFHGLNSVISKGFKKLFYKIIETYSYLKLDKIVLLNNTDFKSVNSFFNYKTELLKTCGLGCNLKIFDKNKYSNEYILKLKSKYKIDDHFVLGYVGRFVNFKGFHIAVKTFIELSKNEKVKLILIGGYDSIHPSGLNDEEKLFFLENKNIINIGFAHNVYDYLPMLDLLVFPTKKEGLPIVATESVAMGVPVICFDARGSNELIINNFNGVLIPQNKNIFSEINAFTREIKFLINNQNFLNSIKENTLLEREKLSRNNFVNNEIKMYHKINNKIL
jgi:glycosyltransferase involved in cell wall biosynthesis